MAAGCAVTPVSGDTEHCRKAAGDNAVALGRGAWGPAGSLPGFRPPPLQGLPELLASVDAFLWELSEKEMGFLLPSPPAPQVGVRRPSGIRLRARHGAAVPTQGRPSSPAVPPASPVRTVPLAARTRPEGCLPAGWSCAPRSQDPCEASECPRDTPPLPVAGLVAGTQWGKRMCSPVRPSSPSCEHRSGCATGPPAAALGLRPAQPCLSSWNRDRSLAGLGRRCCPHPGICSRMGQGGGCGPGSAEMPSRVGPGRCL